MVTENQFEAWAKPSSDTEQEKQERTVRMVKEAIDESEDFDGSSYSVYAKGSYPNNTNVRAESDVDIAVQCHEVFYYEDPDELATHGPGYDGKWTVDFLRSAVESALIAKFGSEVVDTSGKTAIQVNASSARVDADVVPCFDFRCYTGKYSYEEGIRIWRRNWTKVNNYPKKHYSEGVSKNTSTSRRYKRGVRILKRVAGFMEAEHIHREVPSYFIESLVFNCPNSYFSRDTWAGTISDLLDRIEEYAWSAEPDSEAARWREADGFKFLFHGSQKWTRNDAYNFAQEARRYLFA